MVGLWRGEAWGIACPVSSVSDEGSVSVDAKLVELEVDNSGEFGDVLDLLSCCVEVPWMNPIGPMSEV